MNRPLIITIGIVIILIVLGIWVYLILFGSPKDSQEVFANLGFEATAQPTTITPPESSLSVDALVDTTTGKMRQLTTRPTAGYIASTTPNGAIVRYAERGTGHIYEINLTTGAETIISRTTVPQVAQAVFSKNAAAVALTTFSNYTTNVFVGPLTGDSLAGTALEPGARNIAFDSDSEVLYSIHRDGVTTGYRHNLSTQSRTEVFRFNFAELDVTWGAGNTTTHIATKYTPNLEGFVYRMNNNVVTPVVNGAIGLSALITDHTIITTSATETGYQSSAVIANSSATIPLPLVVIKEKCAFDPKNTNLLWCAASSGAPSGNYLNDWYKGTQSANDVFWLVNIEKQTAELVASPTKLTSRTLDATTVTIGNNSTQLYFKHKNDQTLWVLELI